MSTEAAHGELLAEHCATLLGQSDVLASRVRDGRGIAWRIIARGRIPDLVAFVLDEKLESEEVLVWPAGDVCRLDNWAIKYPAQMRAEWRRGRAQVAARRAAVFAEMNDGFCLRMDGPSNRSGWLYHRADDRLLDVYVEATGYEEYDYIIDWAALEAWTYPVHAPLSSESRAQLTRKVGDWLDAQNMSTNPPP